jgi:Flp pilus assembly protein TadD
MKKKLSATEPERTKARILYRENKFRDAGMLFSKISQRNPQDHEAWLMQGLCLQKLGQLQQATAFMERARALKPRSAKILNALGFAWLERGWTDRAIQTLQQALEQKPDYIDAHDNLIKALLAASRYHAAIAACHTALQYSPDSADLLCQLAVALEQTHQLDEARTAANKALKLNPAQVRAGLILAKLDKRSGKLAEACQLLQSLLKRSLPPLQTATLAAELGDVLDRMGDYTGAFKAFDTGNRTLAQTITPAQAAQGSIFDQIERHRQWFSRATTAGWETAPPVHEKPSPLFLVGFPRSGTTLTEQILASLEQIVPSDEKPVLSRLASELPGLLNRPFRYPEDLNNLTTAELVRLRERYWTLVGGMIGPVASDHRLLDKLPLNIIDLGLVYRLFPDAKVIVVIRDPRDSCLSCFMQPFMLNQAMINFLSLEQSALFYSAVMDLWLHYRDTLGLRYLEIRYEDLVSDFEAKARQLVQFIGEQWNDSVLRYFEHARKRDVSTPSYSAIASPVYSRSVGRWKHYRARLAGVDSILAPFLEEFGYSDTNNPDI